MLFYTPYELLQLNRRIVRLPTTIVTTCAALGIARRPRYIHRGTPSSKPKVHYYSSVPRPGCIPIIWTSNRPSSRHSQLTQSNSGAWPSEHRPSVTPCSIDYSVLLKVSLSTDRHVLHTPTSCPNTKLALLNVRSLNNKAPHIADVILANNFDFMFLTETWQQPGEYLQLNEAIPTGYQYIDKPRAVGRGGGLAALYRSVFKVSPVNLLTTDPQTSDHSLISFELAAPAQLTRGHLPRKISFRSIRNVCPLHLMNTIDSVPVPPAPASVDTLTNHYTNTAMSALDLHAPLHSREVTFLHSAPWYTPELRLMKAKGRQLERLSK
ncbi:hypothetical protein SRHO_G00020430 [Serrasalmus rhombeus]